MRALGTFARWAAHLLEGGYSPIPLKPGTKLPLLTGWDGLRSEALSRDQIDWYARRHLDLGLGVAGGFNGLVPVDIDTEVDPIIDAICEALPGFMVAKTGKRGFTTFFRDPAGTIGGRKFQTPLPNRTMLAEILTTGKSVLPPTIHPETLRPYRWLTEKTLLNTRVDELPEFTEAHERALEVALLPWVPARREFIARPANDDMAVSDKRLHAYARAVLDNETRTLEATPKNGGRNQALFVAGCRLGKFAHHKVLPVSTIESALLAACTANGLVKDDGLAQCRATLASALRKSANDPLPVLGVSRRIA